jgi:glycosyltransferase involved in cell wall biosynthesis
MPASARQPLGRDDTVTLVIPAHNEAGRIEAVARAALQASLVTRIIIVDDGSTDGTAQAAAAVAATDARLEVLRMHDNEGKSAALLRGIQAARTDLIAFIDADLIGLTPQHIDDLVRPVLAGTCDMSLGLFRGGRLHTDLAHLATPFLSGQRCLHWELFRDAPLLQDARYAVEVAFSIHARRRSLLVCTVTWSGVTHVTQPEKLGIVRGYLSYLRMYAEIAFYAARLGLKPLAHLW